MSVLITVSRKDFVSEPITFGKALKTNFQTTKNKNQ